MFWLQSGLEAGNAMPDLPVAGVNSHARGVADCSSSGRPHSEDLVCIYEIGGPVPPCFIRLMVSCPSVLP
jgi:hypothetical protein